MYQNALVGVKLDVFGSRKTGVPHGVRMRKSRGNSLGVEDPPLTESHFVAGSGLCHGREVDRFLVLWYFNAEISKQLRTLMG